MPQSTFVDLSQGYRASRSYVSGVNIEFDGATNVRFVDNVIHLDYAVVNRLEIVIKPNWFEWSSRYYAITDVFDDQNSCNIFPPLFACVGFLAFIQYRHVDSNLYVNMRIQFTPGAPIRLEIPAQPANYWLPETPDEA